MTGRQLKARESKNAIFANKHELSSRRLRREEIAIEKTAAALYEIQRSADLTVALDLLPRNREIASLVSQALERIENDTYGTCAECDRPISAKRLAAVPWAKYCIRCQELADGSNL